MKNKKTIVIAIIAIAVIMVQGTVQASGGQASGTTDNLYEKTVSYFFELIRAMETSTGTLGVDSNINTKTYTDSSGNGIDCHLEKNTEYGTVTLLAASEFGNKTSTDTESTGNKGSGVYQMYISQKAEYVANTWSSEENGTPVSNSDNGALISADARYINKYYGTKEMFNEQGYVIAGDGIIETDGYSGSCNFVVDSMPTFYRGTNGLFGYSHNYRGNYSSETGARAVVVCGPGL